MEAVLPVIASVVFAVVIAIAAVAGPVVVAAVAVGLAVAALAYGWPRLLELPAPRGSAAVIALTGWTAAGLAVRAGELARPLAPLTALLAFGVLLAFVHELLRRDGRAHLVESVTGTVSGQTLALLGAGWVLLPSTRLASAAITTAAATVVAGRLAELLPVPPALAGWVALLSGVVGGVAVAALVDRSHLAPLLGVVMLVAGGVAGLDQLLLQLSQGRQPSCSLAVGAAPVLAVGTVAYAVARLVG